MDASFSESVRFGLIGGAKGEQAAPGVITSAEAASSCPIPWRLERARLSGGRQEGVELLTLDNGRLRIRLIPTRGMGILDVTLGELRIGWDSPVREVVHPQFINLESRGGLGWLEGFNEFVVRCGLEWAGAPGPDEFVTNVGDTAQMQLTLHGKIANIPASDVSFEAETVPPYRLRIVGSVREQLLFGPNLELKTELITKAGSSEFLLGDRVKNHSACEQEFQLIYHINVGHPLLGPGARFIGAASRVRPLNARAAESLGQFDRYSAPRKGFVEQVFCILPRADAQGKTAMMLQDPTGERGFLLSYPVAQLSHFSLWKNTAALEDGYVTGLEPATGFTLNRSQERKAGRVPVLAPHGERAFTLRFDVLDGPEAVAAARHLVEQIRAGRQAELERDPLV